MVLRQKKYTPQEFIHIGMAFLLLAIFVTMLADGRFIGVFFNNLIRDKSIIDAIQGIAAGISIPISCASIFFNVRGLVSLQSR